MAITNINEAWEGHSGTEVEGFIKDSFGMKFGYAEYSAGKITFYDNANKDNALHELILSGDIYAISMEMNVGSAVALLTGETEKVITFKPSTTVSHSIGGESEEYPEGYSYAVAYDTGSGFVVRDSGAIRIGETASVDIRPRVVIGTTRIRITVTGAVSEYTRSTIITCTMTNLRFEVSHNWLYPWYEGEDYVVNGVRLDGAITKVLHVKVGDTEVLVDGQLPKPYSPNSNYWQTSTTITIPKEFFPIGENESSGQQVLELWLTGTGIETDHIKYNILCVKENETQPLVCVNNVAEKGVNFSTNTFFNYYTLNATRVDIVPTVVADEIEYDLDVQSISNLEDRVMYAFNTRLEVGTEAETGTVTLQVYPSNADGVNTDGVIEITLPLDNSLQYNAIKDPAPTLYWTASTRSNGETDRGSIRNAAASGSFVGTWSGMTWSSTDGWATDPDGNKALCLPAGCSASFPTLKPFALGKTVEFMFRSSIIADLDTPIMSFTDTALGADGNVTVGCIVYPTKILVLGSQEQKQVTQEVGLCEDVVTHIMLTKNDDYLNSGKSLFTIYVNGIPNISFQYNSNQSTFGQGSLVLGQNSTDFYLYMMRCYDAVLTDSGVLVNYLNAIFDAAANRAVVRERNDIVDAGIQYSKCRTKYNCFIVEPDDDSLDIPSYYNQTKVQCTVYFEYAEHHEWDVKITNVPIDGQGTTSKKYFRWNLRGKLASSCEWFYTDGNGETIGTYSTTPSTVSTGKKGFMDGGEAGAAGHTKIDRFTAKKNVASSQQGHKIGATGLYDDLFTQLGLKSELPSSKYRVAVWQYPFLGFRKRKGQDIYDYIGLYTIGPDKGCKVSFGYKDGVDGGVDYSACMCIEGPNHSPRGTRFLHPWVDVWYDNGEETLKFGTGEFAEEAWDDDFSAGYDSDTSDPAEAAAILDMYVSEWKPAYDLVYHCSPYIASLQEAFTQHYDILELSQNGNYTDAQIVEAINTHLSVFQSPNVRTNREKNDLMSYYDSNYDIWYFRNTTQRYEKLVREDGDTQDGRWNIKTYLGLTGNPTTAQIVAARAAKFKTDIGNYFSVNQTLFHKAFCLLIGAKDNDAKNTYPFKHLKLSDGGRWGWKQDDLDSIFSTDNNGMATMKYSIEQGDLSGNVEIFQGSDSAFWTLIWRNYQTGTGSEPSIQKMMSDIMEGLRTIVQNNHWNTSTDNYLHDFVYRGLEHYFFKNSSLYFPIVAYQEDRTFAYLDPWRVAGTASPNGTPYQNEYNSVPPLTQALGDRYQDERLWIERRIAYIFSKYRIGAFTGSQGGCGEMAFSLAENFTFRLVPAIDLYPVVNRGGGQDVQAGRTLAGNEAVINMTGDASGTGYYVKAVDWLKSLGDLSGMKLGIRTGGTGMTIAFSISARRLENFKVGDENAANVVFNAQELTVTSAPALKIFDARNLTTLTSIVDLRKCYRLREAYFGGSTAIGLLLPVGSRLTKVTFPIRLQTLFLHTLNQLTPENMELPDETLDRIQAYYFYKSEQLNPFTILHTILSTEDNVLTYVYMNWDGTIPVTDTMWDDLLELATDIDEETPKYKNATYNANGVGFDNFNRANLVGKISAHAVVKEELDIIQAAFPNLIIQTERVLEYVSFTDRFFWAECCYFWGDVEFKQGVIDHGEITADGVALVYSDFTYANCRALPARRLAEGTTFAAVAAASQNFEVTITINSPNPFSSFAGDDEVIKILEYPDDSTLAATALASITLANWETGSSNGTMTIPVTASTTCNFLRVAALADANVTVEWSINAVTGSYRPVGVTPTQMAIPTSLGNRFSYTRILKDLRELSYFTNVKSLANNEFYDASSITRLAVPPNVTTIGQYAFKQCSALYDLQLPEGLTALGGEQVLYDCDALKVLELPSTVRTFGSQAFGSNGIEQLVFPEGIVTLSADTTRTANSVKTMVLPSTLTGLGSNFLMDATAMQTLIVRGQTFAFSGSYNFRNVPSSMRIIVPTNSVGSYRTASTWSGRANYILPMINGDTFNITNGVYEYSLAKELNATDITWSIADNSYLTMMQQTDGTALVMANGITDDVDVTVDIQCTFTSYGHTMTDALTIKIKHYEYFQFEDDIVNQITSYYFGDVRADMRTNVVVASGTFNGDGGNLVSSDLIFASNMSAGARTMSNGLRQGIPAHTTTYELEVDFGTNYPFETLAAGVNVLFMREYTNNNASATNPFLKTIEDISEDVASLGGKYKITFSTTSTCRFISVNLRADVGVTATWKLTRISGFMYEPIGVTLSQIQAVTGVGATAYNHMKCSNFKEFKHFTGVTSLAKDAFSYTTLGTLVLPPTIQSVHTGRNANTFYNSRFARLIITEGANLASGDAQFYYQYMDNWVLGESCTKLWNIFLDAYSGVYPKRRVIMNTLTVKKCQSQSYLSTANMNFHVYVPFGLLDEYKADSSWAFFVNNNRIHTIGEYEEVDILRAEGYIPDYIDFEDTETARICCNKWGDYVEIVKTETVTEDSETVTISTVYTKVSMLNTTVASRTAIKTVESTREKTEEDTVGTTSTTTKTPIGITKAQAAAVTNIGTTFANSGMRSFAEFRFFTGHQTTLSKTHYGTGTSNGFTKLVLPPQMTGIAVSSFNQSNVNFLEVGASFSSIGMDCFRYSTIGTFVLHNPIPPSCGGNSISSVNAIYVPDESVDTYKAASRWSMHASKIHPISEYEGTLYLT